MGARLTTIALSNSVGDVLMSTVKLCGRIVTRRARAD
jgi:hypothetical protein